MNGKLDEESESSFNKAEDLPTVVSNKKLNLKKATYFKRIHN